MLRYVSTEGVGWGCFTRGTRDSTQAWHGYDGFVSVVTVSRIKDYLDSGQVISEVFSWPLRHR